MWKNIVGEHVIFQQAWNVFESEASRDKYHGINNDFAVHQIVLMCVIGWHACGLTYLRGGSQEFHWI